MPAEHLRALIRELHPNVTVRQLSLAAGLDANRIAYYLKPSTEVVKMPEPAALKEIARALGCELDLVVEAFAADIGLPWGPSLSDPEIARLVRNYRQLNRSEQLALQRVVETGVPWEGLDDPELTRLVQRFLRLSKSDQKTLARVAQSLAGGR